MVFLGLTTITKETFEGDKMSNCFGNRQQYQGCHHEKKICAWPCHVIQRASHHYLKPRNMHQIILIHFLRIKILRLTKTKHLFICNRYTIQIIYGKSCMIKFLVKPTRDVFIKRCLKITNMPSFAFFVVVINDAL